MKTGLLTLLTLLLTVHAQAGSATWNLNPVDNQWFNASNWTPAAIPNGAAGVATFGVTNLAVISDMGDTLSEIVFNANASSYLITAGLGSHVIDGPGITNNSGTQKFIVIAGQGEGTFGEISFINNASAGAATQFAINGTNTHAFFAGDIAFHDTTTAGFGIYTTLPGTVEGGIVYLFDTATAGTATFFNFGAVSFQQNSRADMAYFETEGGTISGGFGGYVELTGGSRGGTAQFVVNAGSVAGAHGGKLAITGSASAESASIFANDGPGDGGLIQFDLLSGTNGGGTATFQLNGKGTLDVSDAGIDPGVGSLSGNGHVFLGSRALKIGTNNLSTDFTGTIQDGGIGGGTGGSIEKVGTGAFSLETPNLYSGGTTLSRGMLIVHNSTGSATGSGPVQVSGGTIGGDGLISGAVMIGDGSRRGASLAPSHGTRVLMTLTLQGTVTFASNSRYVGTLMIHGTQVSADKVIANGVIIDSNASFFLRGLGQGTAGSGFTTIIVISNTSAAPISGTFANLPDGAILTVNGNNFQASYEGGDGNDLTLTVVP